MRRLSSISSPARPARAINAPVVLGGLLSHFAKPRERACFIAPQNRALPLGCRAVPSAQLCEAERRIPSPAR